MDLTHTRSICFLLKLILRINNYISRVVLCTFEKVSMDLQGCLPLHLWECFWYSGLISRRCSLSWAWQHYLIVGSWPFLRLSMQVKKKTKLQYILQACNLFLSLFPPVFFWWLGITKVIFMWPLSHVLSLDTNVITDEWGQKLSQTPNKTREQHAQPYTLQI